MKNKINISIGIPAYNEEANIKNLLSSILRQKEDGFLIKEIVVISDGSTDGTVEKVKEIRDKRIRLIDGKQRVGKSKLLNNLFDLAKNDVLVLLDADVILKNTKVIQPLISPFIKDEAVGLVGGNPQPLLGRNFIERSINSSFSVYSVIRERFKDGNNVYGCQGSILALSRKFYKKVHIPEKMIGNDSYLYYSCLINGFKFIHASSAIVSYRSPSTLRDHFRQNKRFIAAQFRLRRVFGDLVVKEHYVPKPILYKLLLNQFLKAPVNSLFIFSVNKVVYYVAKNEERKMTAIWPIASSTKKGVKRA